MPFSKYFTIFLKTALFMFFCISQSGSVYADSKGAARHFDKILNQSASLRLFLQDFPKGADLHSHLSGVIYAENFIKWAAKDGKCVDLASHAIAFPPCDSAQGRPSVKSIENNDSIVNGIIDAFSTRNYERRPVSGHDQFFATFMRFSAAGAGRQGHMIAEATARAALQNILYLELMQSNGMGDARALAANDESFKSATKLEDLIKNKAMNKIVDDAILTTDQSEKDWKATLKCQDNAENPGCKTEVRYLAQVIRTFPPEQVLAQTILAYKLIEKDPRYVGLNFVAPEDHPVTLRDHRLQMEIIRDVGNHFPATNISLHAGELTLGLVPPEDLKSHINEAIHIAGARRIGHGIDIAYETQAQDLLNHMSENNIMVEINLTSNDVILGVKGDDHPFSLYRANNVPMALSTDDEGVSRIDLTHEYMRAARTYDLSYRDLKNFSRNALEYSFLEGNSLFQAPGSQKTVKACAKDQPKKNFLSKGCHLYLEKNKKAMMQWELEKRFVAFEKRF